MRLSYTLFSLHAGEQLVIRLDDGNNGPGFNEPGKEFAGGFHDVGSPNTNSWDSSKWLTWNSQRNTAQCQFDGKYMDNHGGIQDAIVSTTLGLTPVPVPGLAEAFKNYLASLKKS